MIRVLTPFVFLGIACAAQAMEFRVAGNELHLRGAITGEELALFKDALAEHPRIDTVVFRESLGGDVWTALRVGERIRDAGMRTVLAGRCHSACALMFLGGNSRHFVHATRPEFMYLAFHGTWSAAFMRHNMPSFGGRVAVRDWIVQRTATKLDAALLERFLGEERRNAFLYVYDPLQLKREGAASMYFCDGSDLKRSQPYQACEKVGGHDAFSMGFVTSAERVKVTPFASLPEPFKPRTAGGPLP